MSDPAPIAPSQTATPVSPPAGTLLSPGPAPTVTETVPKPGTPSTPSPSTPTTTPTPAPTEPAPGETLLSPAEGEAAGAPEAYADFVLPEGFEMPAELKAEAETLLKELNLPQDKAQKAVDFFTAKLKAAGEANATAFNDLKATWRAEAVANKDIGTGTQIKLEVLQTVGRAIDGLGAGAQPFRDAMNLTGVGDNPAFISAFFALAKRATEGRPASAASPAPVAAPDAKPASLASAIYPNLPA